MRKAAIVSIVSLCVIIVSMIIIVSTASHNISSRNNVDASTSISSDGPVTFDDKLARYDAALDHAINMCSKDIYPSTKQMCINDIEDAWWIECAEHYDKLDTCKSGKVENFLKNEGVPT